MAKLVKDLSDFQFDNIFCKVPNENHHIIIFSQRDLICAYISKESFNGCMIHVAS